MNKDQQLKEIILNWYAVHLRDFIANYAEFGNKILPDSYDMASTGNDIPYWKGIKTALDNTVPVEEIKSLMEVKENCNHDYIPTGTKNIVSELNSDLIVGTVVTRLTCIHCLDEKFI